MSRKLLAFLLSELRTIRIVCKGQIKGKPCGTVLEVPLSNLADFFARTDATCRHCNTSWLHFPSPGDAQEPFRLLAQAINNFANMKERVDVEFVLPDKE